MLLEECTPVRRAPERVKFLSVCYSTSSCITALKDRIMGRLNFHWKVRKLPHVTWIPKFVVAQGGVPEVGGGKGSGALYIVDSASAVGGYDTVM